MAIFQTLSTFEYFIFFIGLGWLLAVWTARKVKIAYTRARQGKFQYRAPVSTRKKVHPLAPPGPPLSK